MGIGWPYQAVVAGAWTIAGSPPLSPTTSSAIAALSLSRKVSAIVSEAQGDPDVLPPVERVDHRDVYQDPTSSSEVRTRQRIAL